MSHCTAQVPRKSGISTITNSYRRRANGTLPDVLFCRAHCTDLDATTYGGDRAFRQGLNEEGIVEGRNAAIEQRWADNDRRRLEDFAVDLVRREVAVIVGNSVAVDVAKTATTTILIVFVTGDDPIKMATGRAAISQAIYPRKLKLISWRRAGATVPNHDVSSVRSDSGACRLPWKRLAVASSHGRFFLRGGSQSRPVFRAAGMRRVIPISVSPV